MTGLPPTQTVLASPTIAAAYTSHLQRTITSIFEEQAGRTPQDIAAVYEGDTLTYSELNRRSNQLAHYLQTLGVKAGDRVGICVERSLQMIVGLLGILKTGAAYVPLDQNYPEERLVYMVQNSGVDILLVQQKLATKIRIPGVRLVTFEEERDTIAAQPESDPVTATTSDHPAYIIYTSGSTGRPKGVCISHRNAVRLVINTNYADFTADQVFLQFASISFDVAAFEIWGALLNGARLIIFPAHTPSVEELGEWILQNQVTTLWLTAGLFHQIVEVDCGKYFRNIRQLLAGGDVLSVPLVRKFLRQYPACRLINGYGPTENGTFSTCGELREMSEDAASVIIGRPIANSTAYVLDVEMSNVATGEIGELYLGGGGLAHGYWNQPVLTAEKFVPNPFAQTPGERLYRSGDLGRYLPDGNLEFAGRIDQQVKLRGFRIELGEIEAVLVQHPGIAQATVLVREDKPGDKSLIAYVVPRSESPMKVFEIREYISRKLPEYMTPAAFVFLETLPLTPNGKVDRKALPTPDHDRPLLEQPYEPPATMIEKQLSQIWAEVLHINTIGTNDSFYELGGDSLLATRVLSRVYREFDISLPLRTFLEQPVIAHLARRLEIAQREKHEGQAISLEPAPRGQEIPIGCSQERVWFLQRLDPASIAYQFQATLNIKGPLNIKALEDSLTALVQRHEILRTTFIEKDGRAIQIIHEPFAVSVPVVDLRRVEREGLDHTVERLVKAEITKRFDVARLPLIRWLVFSLAKDEHLLLHIEHHLIHDGWSFNIFLGELFEIYKASTADTVSSLARFPLQFADFAAWQQRNRRSEAMQLQLSYWKDKLSGGLPVSEFPADYLRPRVQTFNGALCRVPLSLALSREVRSFAYAQEVSLFVVMMSAFFALAYQYTHQEDFCVGSSMANRRHPETESLLGMLVNNVVLRAQMPAATRFQDLLAQVRNMTFEAYENQEVPFHDVIQSLNMNHDLSSNPLFQTSFNFHNSPVTVPDIPELDLRLVEAVANGAAKFDLSVIVIPATAQRLRLNPEWDKDTIVMLWEYNTDLFRENTALRIIAHYQQVLQIMLSHPERKIEEACLLTTDEQRQMLVDWNQTAEEVPSRICAHELFERQVIATPELPAVGQSGQMLTYGELNRRANQIARYLQKHAVGVEARVGICMERCMEMVMTMLGIWKAGGAYVPLDPNYPATVLEYMVRDAGLTLLVTSQALENKLSGIADKTICLDQLLDGITKEPDDNLQTELSEENLAYVIYTSGSTGSPKGVTIPHRGLVNLAAWHVKAHKLTTNDRATQIAAQAFDASVWELWPYLLAGSYVELPDADALALQEKLFEWLAVHEITICFLPTPLAEFLFENPLPRELKLRELLTGGDRLPHGRWSDFSFQVTNHYGPTENTVVTTWGTAVSGTIPPIGKPIANTRVYVLDDNQQPVAIGIAGELYVGGRGLARGYLNRPALTAEKFVPDALSGLPGERLYQTGDIVRYLANGQLEFIGRKDHQIKLRGFRIELGEIEAALLKNPEVKHAVVVLRQEPGEEKQLVAYVVPRTWNFNVDDLRTFLQQRLPIHMVPFAYVKLAEIPLTPNGKIDRRTLPPPAWDVHAARSYEAPQGDLERTLAGIFSDVLRHEKISRHDSFFALGGHSLLATKLISRVRSVLGVELPIRNVFQLPSVAVLAPVVEELVMEDIEQMPEAEAEQAAGL